MRIIIEIDEGRVTKVREEETGATGRVAVADIEEAVDGGAAPDFSKHESEVDAWSDVYEVPSEPEMVAAPGAPEAAGMAPAFVEQ